MKFLVEHRVTGQILAEWATDAGTQYKQSIIIAKHYFWSIGTAIQRSQEGLMRSILLQVLMQRPRLIRLICAERWAAPYADSFHPWTRSQLKSAMASLGHTNVRMCLFIDGLDEYGGDHGELTGVLTELSQSPNIKICVSSRPWIDFVDAFDSSPWKLYLQDLTRLDIRDYVTDMLERDAKFRRLKSSSRVAALDFIQSVTTRSEGVFLWVYLVIRSLLRGLRNEDDLSMLRSRLDALPVDLEEYFERMLSSIEDVYRPRTARLFLTLCYARTSFPVLTFFFFDLDDPQSTDAAQISQGEPLELLSNWPDVDADQFEALISKKRQLVAQCKDMIHISPDPKAHILFGERVGFLHRTVVNFIETDNIFKRLETLSGPYFDPRRLLFGASLGQARSLIHLHRLTFIRQYLTQWILGCLFYAYEIEATTTDGYGQVLTGLDELEKIVLRGFARWNFHHAMQTLLDRSDVFSFLDLAARCDLKAYVEWKHPDGNPAYMLDEFAFGWRTPCHVRRGDVSDFEISPLTDQELGSWRLGTYVEVDKDSKTAREAFNKTEQISHHYGDNRVDEVQVMVQEKRRRKLLRRLKAALH